MHQFEEIARRVLKYHPSPDLELLRSAYEFAAERHRSQVRASGEPYLNHLVETALLACDLKLDVPSVVAALLHDTVEDTMVTREEIAAKFGDEIADIVDGVTKLTRIEFESKEEKQAESFRKMLLAMAKDIRVVLVKLCDRLHNMRTLDHLREEKRRAIAHETKEIYAPLANRLGIHWLKSELEDRCLMHLRPELYETIKKNFEMSSEQRDGYIESTALEIQKQLEQVGVSAAVKGRAKHFYSVWQKMERDNIAFDEVYDLIGFRVIVSSLRACYETLGIVHSVWKPVPNRFKDYIAMPKPNMYQSLHTTVIGPGGQRIEIQIRTPEMNNIAEEGIAAHWRYKEGDVNPGFDLQWVKELVETQQYLKNPDEFIQSVKGELFPEEVFVFTPRGDLLRLPFNGTPIDFAYAVHSAVGDKCVGAKINGRIAPLNTKLHNGDQVEIITAKNQTPSPTWERFVVSGKARSHIRRFIRTQQRGEYVTLGKAMLQKVFQQEGYEFTDKAVQGVIEQFQMQELDDVYAGVGSGNLVAREVFRAIFPAHKTPTTKKPTDAEVEQQTIQTRRPEHMGANNKPLPIKGLIAGMAMHFARCCHPLPGDRIVGIVTTGKGVTIHTIDCDTLENFADTPERWLDVSWDDGPDTPESHVGRIEIVVANVPGALGTISTVIGKNGGNITNLNITSRSLDFWDMSLDVYVNDTKHLSNIIAALRATPQIAKVDRARGR